MIKKILHRTLLKAEALFDRIRGPRDKERVIEPYIGYATPEHRVLRGRVLTSLVRRDPGKGQSRLTNFRQMLGLFLTDEVAQVTVCAEGKEAVTGEEGYFHLHLPLNGESGWSEVEVRVKDDDSHALCPVMVADPAADFGVISDIDDTVLVTGAYSLVRNLWTSLTGNALTRKIFPDAVSFMETLSEGNRNPIYYVSSSPWNLHNFLSRIFDRTGLVRGPKFLRDLGLSEKQFITGTHGDHKGGSIDIILAANPDLNFVLVGDTGQHDAFVYRDAASRHPGRIAAVVLREPGPGPDEESLAAMKEIEALGIPLFHGVSFDGFAEKIRERLSKA